MWWTRVIDFRCTPELLLPGENLTLQVRSPTVDTGRLTISPEWLRPQGPIHSATVDLDRTADPEPGWTASHAMSIPPEWQPGAYTVSFAADNGSTASAVFGVAGVIDGYCSAESVYPGEEISFHLSARGGALVDLAVTRLRADEPAFTTSVEVADYPRPVDAQACRWPAAHKLLVPEDWNPGVYRVTATTGKSICRELLFVVKAPRPTSSILLSLTTATNAAYNPWPEECWPGKSLYSATSPTRSRKVSLDRPGGWALFNIWEEPFVRWAESEGIGFDVCTSLDLHRDPELLSRYQLLLSVGHDEYWSKEMRDNVEAFIGGGGNAVFLSGNTCCSQIRYEDEDRTVVCYRDPAEDPLTGVDNERVTTFWDSAPVERSSTTLIGVGVKGTAFYTPAAGCESRREDAAYEVRFPEHWVFDDAPLAVDGTFGRGENIIGYETDAAEYVEADGTARATLRDGAPANLVILATADLTSWRGCGHGGHATMVIFRRNGTVFTASTTDWSHGLSKPGSAVPQITRNVISRLSTRRSAYEWELIGTAPSIVSLTTFESRLYGICADGRLWRREATPQNVDWTEIGPATAMYALCSTEWSSGRLVAAGKNGLSWRHVADERREWHPMGDAPSGLHDLAGSAQTIYGIADEALHHRGTALRQEPWASDDTVEKDIVAVDVAMPTSVLVGATRSGELVKRQQNHREWQVVGDLPGEVTGIAALPFHGRVVATTTDKRVWWRPLW